MWFSKPKEVEELPFPNMKPFVVERSDKKQPSNEEVDKLFVKLICDLDYDSTKRSVFKGWTHQEKWEFVLRQEDHERRVPSPEWLIDHLAAEFDIHYITSTSLNLKTARLGWIDRFCISGGHVLLIRELASFTAYHQLFINSFPKPVEKANEILKALKAVVDTRQGSQHMLLFVKAIEVIVCSIDIFQPKQFETILYILLPYVFMDNGPSLLVSAFKKLADRNNHRFTFRIFADEILANPNETANNIFFTFITGLYTAMSQNIQDRLMLDFEYESSNIITALQKLPENTQKILGAQLNNLLNSIKLDFNEISLIWSGSHRKLIHLEDFLYLIKDHNKASALIIQLFSILNNNSESSDAVFEYLNSFILRLRKGILDGLDFETSTKIAHDHASSSFGDSNHTLPKDSSISSNLYYQYLNETYEYISDEDVRRLPMAIPQNQEELASLRAKVQSLEASLNEAGSVPHVSHDDVVKQLVQTGELYQIPEVQEILKERDNLRQEIKEQQNKTDSEAIAQIKEENRVLQEELALSRQKYEEISVQLSTIEELVKFVPSEIKIPQFSKLDSAAFVPRNETKSANSTLSKIREQLKAKNNVLDESLNGLFSQIENQLHTMEIENSSTVDRAGVFVKTIESERQVAASTIAHVQEVHSKILSTLKMAPVSQSRYSESSRVFEFNDSEAPIHDTRRLLWHKLPDTCSSTDEWAQVIKKKVDANAEEMMKYFGSEQIDQGKLLSSSSSELYQDAIEKISMSPIEIEKALRNELFALQPEGIEDLLRLPVSKTEIDRLISFNGDIYTLSAPEQLAVYLQHLPNWRNKAEAMLEHHKFDTTITVMLQQLHKVEDALAQIKKSEVLTSVLSVVLTLGNFLNGGTGIGDAKGFSINILKELKYLRTNCSGLSFLHYVGILIDRHYKSEFDLQTELDKIRSASLIDVDTIMQRLKSAQIALAPRMGEPFAVASSRRLLDAMKYVSKINADYDCIANAFGIREELLRPPVLLSLLASFVADFSRATKENSIRGVVSSPPVTKKKPIPVSEDTDDERQRGIISSMVNALKATDAPARRIKKDLIQEDEKTEFEKAFAKVKRIVSAPKE